MNDLEAYFQGNKGRQIHKWLHYFDIYDAHFRRFRSSRPVILEIGVDQGGSLQMWKAYFGPGARIVGMDIDPRCKAFEEDGIQVLTGSQADRKFLRDVADKVGPIDILIDDGGHTMRQQLVTFEELFGAVKKDGVYLCEDVHTSYWLRYGGGCRRRGSFIEFSKALIDQLNAWHSEERRLQVGDFTRSAKSIHFYDSIVVIEKGEHPKPEHRVTGIPSFDGGDGPSDRGPRREEHMKWLAARLLRRLRLPIVIGPRE